MASDDLGLTGLIVCSDSGYADVVRAILARHPKVDAQTAHGETALIRATIRGHLEVVNALLEAGVDTNIEDSSGKDALQWANEKGFAAIVDALKKAASIPTPTASAPVNQPESAPGSLHHKLIPNQQIRDIVPNRSALIHNRQASLSPHGDAAKLQF